MFPLIAAGLAATTTLVMSSLVRAKGSKDTDVDVDTGNADAPDEIDLDERPSGAAIDTRELASLVGAPAIWQDFFALVSYGESRDNDDVGLGHLRGAPVWVKMNISENDADAAARSYDRNIGWLKPCWGRDEYTFGSGGRFQMFPASALAAFKSDAIYKCTHPWSVFDPKPSMIYAAWMARRLQQWKNWTGTVMSMRAGWANPSTMHDPDKWKREKWGGHCQSVGLPPSFLDKTLPKWKPKPARELWSSIIGTNGWLPPAVTEAA